MSRRGNKQNGTALQWSGQRRAAAPAAIPIRLFSLAPRRGLMCPGPLVRCSRAELLDEAALLARVRQACLERCACCFHQPEVDSCQEVRPEAFSLVAPPERCWLLGLREAEPTGAVDPGEVTGFVALRGHDLCVLLW